MRSAAPPRIVLLGLAAATAAMLLAGLLLPADPMAWRFALILLASISAGSALAALIGRLLSRDWLDVVEDELLPAGIVLAIVLLLGLPLLAGDGAAVAAPFGDEEWASHQAVWFSAAGVVLRLLAFAAAVVTLSVLMLRKAGDRDRIAGFGAPVLTALFALAVLDWVVLRPPVWWTALLPIGYIVNQCTAALSVAFIFHFVQGERGRDDAFASLATALLSLALLDLWIGYAQYLIAWYGNLPEAVAFYRARGDAGPLLEGAAIAQAAGAAILLLRRTRRTMMFAAVLLLSAYSVHAAWLAGDHRPQGIGGWVVVLLLAILWTAWVWALSRWVDARAAAARGTPANPVAASGH